MLERHPPSDLAAPFEPEAEDFDLADGVFTVVDRAGVTHRLPGVEGMSLMEILTAAGQDVPATCGGAAQCGTCHIYIKADDFSRLPPVKEEEEAQLDNLGFVRAHSRLACQILWNRANLDGLSFTLAPLEGG